MGMFGGEKCPKCWDRIVEGKCSCNTTPSYPRLAAARETNELLKRQNAMLEEILRRQKNEQE